jgi:hypothetical protein
LLTGKLLHLEAVRGLAACAVVLNHLLLAFWPVFAEDRSISPLLKVTYKGSFAVAVFFVLSGFVLSLSFFRTRDVRVVTSAAVRRYPRLALPVAGLRRPGAGPAVERPYGERAVCGCPRPGGDELAPILLPVSRFP